MAEWKNLDTLNAYSALAASGHRVDLREVLSGAAGGGICKTAFSLFAMKQVDFNIPAFYMIITVIGIVTIAIITSGMAGIKVRGLKPVEMITED